MSMTAVQHGFVDLMIGALFVLFHSASRFNTPSTNRSSTTFGRYSLALGLYCVAALATYALLVHSPYLVTFLATGAPGDLPSYLQELSSPLVMALLMTVLLAKLPVLSNVDSWILEQLQNMAAIPHEVRRLTAELRKQSPDLDAANQAEVRRRLLSDGFDQLDIRFDPGHEPAQIWCRVTALLLKMEGWESDRRMVMYMQSYSQHLNRIRERHTALVPTARTCFKLVRQSAAADEGDKAREAVQRYAEAFTGQLDALNRDLLEFISRGILASEMTDSGRIARLALLGFTLEATATELTVNQLLSLFGLVAIVVLISYALLIGTGGATQGIQFARALTIALIFSIAVASVVIPRQRWRIARWSPGGHRPVLFYIVAGLMAVVITQAISLAFSCILARDLSDGWLRYRFTYPWLVVTFATSVMTACLIDNPPNPRFSKNSWRLVEGMIGAVVLILAAMVTHTWLSERVEFLGVDVADRLEFYLPPRGLVLAPAAVIGFSIGFLVPAWFRVAPTTKATAGAQVTNPPAITPASL